jgi:hypothetical protein
MQVTVSTYDDVVSHALDYLGSATDAETQRLARRAVQGAVNAFWSQRQWSYFYKRLRVITNIPYSTGVDGSLITYLVSAGAVPRQVTLIGGTWPSWAANGQLGLGQIPYQVSGVISPTALQLASNMAPNADITTPTSYVLSQPDYTLPADFGAMDELVNMGFARSLLYQTPGNFVAQQRVYIGPANPFMYTIQADPRRYGALMLSFWPPPDQVYNMDASYRRQSRALTILGYSTGSVNTTNGSTIISGNGTIFTPKMVGCIIRFAQQSGQKIPTGPGGASPFFLQRSVVGFTDSTHIAVDQDPQNTIPNCPYIISDPVDLEPGAMSNYFLREIEMQFRIIRRIESTKFEEQHYQKALMSAFEADARHYESRSTGSSGLDRVRIATMPTGPNLGG